MQRITSASFLVLRAALFVARPAAAQDAAHACANEVQRLSEAFQIGETKGEAKVTIQQAPGAQGSEPRRGAAPADRPARQRGAHGRRAGR